MARTRIWFAAIGFAAAVGAGGCKHQPTVDPATIDPAAIDPELSATIRHNIEELQVCYLEALRSDPNVAGKMSYTLTISPQGRVTKVNIDEDTMNERDVRRCIVAKLTSWRFPPASDHGRSEPAMVTFGVSFTSS